MKNIKHLRRNRLIAIQAVGKSKSGHYLWLCNCDCGGVTTVDVYRFLSGHTKSCGCHNSERIKARNFRHGFSGTRLVSVWKNMKKRCENKNNYWYKNYGGRGILVEWTSCADFIKDMNQSYLSHVATHGETNTTLDRIDSDGNYSAANCRWATRREQNRNKRNNRVLEWQGAQRTLAECAEMAGMPRNRLAARLDILGWSLDRAMTTI